MVIIGGLKIGAIYSLAAIGLVVIHKATKTVNFAHGGLVMLGAFAAYIMVVELAWPYWLAFILVPIVIGVISAGLEVTILRPLRRADLFIVIMATIFLGIALSETFRLAQNTEMLAVPAPIEGPPIFIEFGDDVVIVTLEQIWVGFGALAAGLIGLGLFRYAAAGRSMRAMAANVRGAQLCGYSIDRVYALAWFVGGALAGLAGLFAAPSHGVSPELAIATIAAAFVAAVIGGFDSLFGAIIGGLLLGLAETLSAAYVSSAMKSAVSFLLLFVILLWRPEGLFPEARGRDV